MATMNFSVPDDVKTAFDKAFSDQNKSAIVADLMRRAVRESEQRTRRERLIRQLAGARASRPTYSTARLRKARNADRA